MREVEVTLRIDADEGLTDDALSDALFDRLPATSIVWGEDGAAVIDEVVRVTFTPG